MIVIHSMKFWSWICSLKNFLFKSISHTKLSYSLRRSTSRMKVHFFFFFLLLVFWHFTVQFSFTLVILKSVARIFFQITICVPLNKDRHTGLECHEGVNMVSQFSFLYELFLEERTGNCEMRKLLGCDFWKLSVVAPRLWALHRQPCQTRGGERPRSWMYCRWHSSIL